MKISRAKRVVEIKRVPETPRVPEVPRVPTLEPGRSYPLISPQHDCSEEDKKDWE